MQLTFIRKNLLEITATITPVSGSNTPSAVTVELQFPTLAGPRDVASVSLSSVGSNWVGTWDSTAAGQGTVYWVCFSTGPVVGAVQGQFEICANAANTV